MVQEKYELLVIFRIMNINIFNEKELEIIALMAPPKTAQEVVEIVIRDWFNSNVQRMHENAKTLTEKIDEVIADNAQKVDTPVVK